MDSTFIYALNVDGDEPIMLIDKNIGIDETGQGIAGDVFQRELLMLDEMDKKRIQVWINSPGGFVSDGWAIYNSILKTKTPVDTYCIGMAASIAAVIFQAGRKRIMADYGILMYHNPSGSDDKKSLDAVRDSIIKMICSKSGMDETDCSKMMDRTTFINAEEALEMKLCDDVEVSESLNTKYLKRVNNNSDEYFNQCKRIVNQLKNNNMANTKIAMLLGLSNSATDDNIISAISDLKKKKDEAEDDAEDFKKKKDDLEDELDKLKKKKAALEDELDKLKKKMKSMEDDAEDAEEDALEDKARNFVQDYAKKGRIKNEKSVIAKWTGMAIKSFKDTGSFDEIKATIEDLPINKLSVSVEQNNVNNAAPTTAVGLAAQLMNKLRKEGRKI